MAVKNKIFITIVLFLFMNNIGSFFNPTWPKFVEKSPSPIDNTNLTYPNSEINISVELAAKSDTVLSPIYSFGLLNVKEKRNLLKQKLDSDCEFSSFVLIFSLLQCGDIHPQPGPAKRQPRDPCVVCGKGVISSSKAVDCDGCGKWTHVGCTGFISRQAYNKLVSEQLEFSFTCRKCDIEMLPYSDTDHVSGTDDGSISDTRNSTDNIANDSYFQCFQSKGLHFIHLNVRSLLPKIDELKIIARKSKGAVISITETWLDDSVTISEINIPGYIPLRHDRNRNGGGVAAYVRDDLAFNPRPDLHSANLELLWFELLLPKSKPILVGTCYRPPNQKNFLDLLEDNLSKQRSDCDIFVLGDLNICMKNKSSSLCKSYQSILNIFGCEQLITTPTRVTHNSSSIIDHVITNCKEKVCQSGSLPLGLSDHDLVYCTRKIVRGQIGKHNTVRVRSLKNYSIEALCTKLVDTNWSRVLNCKDAEESWNAFKDIFTSVIDSMAPIKEVRLKNRTEPWINAEILSKIRLRDEILYKFRKLKCNELYRRYCQLRNEVQRLVRCAKSSYLLDKVEEHKNDSRKLWQDLKLTGYKSKLKNSGNFVLNIDGNNCYDSHKLADHFNKFYTSVASSLVDRLPSPPNIYNPNGNVCKQFYNDKGVQLDSFQLHTVSEEFILKELRSLNVTKSTGLDNIPPRFLKDGAEYLVKPILHIVNLSIEQNVVPNELKYAKVKPLYKKGSKLEVGNYRPVSVLCSVSKILEKSVYMQLVNYLDANDLIYHLQSGFRGNYSTETCHIHLMDYVREQTAMGNFTGMLLIDLQKAFDTVNHDLLCEKLKVLGCSNSCTKWFKSYLSHRKQLVNIGNVNSELCEISCGVPQGSLLGPLLFLCYVNDMCTSVTCKLMLYADDSALLVSHKDPNFISTRLSEELKSCKSWFIDNKLSMHMGKTECILFGSHRKLKAVKHFSVKCDEVVIHAVKCVKYLGLEIDSTLSGEKIVNSIVKRTNSRLKFLYRNSDCLDMQSRKTLCNSLIQCQFDYCCPAWFPSITKDLKDKLQVAQNKVVRFILKLPDRSHIGFHEFSQIKLLNVQNRVQMLQLSHVFKIFHNSCPDYLANHFNTVSSVHQYSTRSSVYNFHVPKVNGFSSKTFYFTGISFWNSLPNYIKEINSKNHFKMELKLFLANQIAL